MQQRFTNNSMVLDVMRDIKNESNLKLAISKITSELINVLNTELNAFEDTKVDELNVRVSINVRLKMLHFHAEKEHLHLLISYYETLLEINNYLNNIEEKINKQSISMDQMEKEQEKIVQMYIAMKAMRNVVYEYSHLPGVGITKRGDDYAPEYQASAHTVLYRNDDLYMIIEQQLPLPPKIAAAFAAFVVGVVVFALTIAILPLTIAFGVISAICEKNKEHLLIPLAVIFGGTGSTGEWIYNKIAGFFVHPIVMSGPFSFFAKFESKTKDLMNEYKGKQEQKSEPESELKMLPLD